MLRLRRPFARPRVSIDPLSAAALAAGAMLLAALGIYFTRPTQHASHTATAGAGATTTVPSLVSAGLVPAPTTSPPTLGGQLPVTGGPLAAPPTTHPAPSTTTTTSPSASAAPARAATPLTTSPASSPPVTSSTTTTTTTVGTPPTSATTAPPGSPKPPPTPPTIPDVPFPIEPP